MRFMLDRERQEAGRKREGAHELSKSPNAKIVVVGDETGLPIILSEK